MPEGDCRAGDGQDRQGARQPGARFPGCTRLVWARGFCKLSVSDLADISGVCERSIRQYEAGRSDPSASNLERLATALGVRMEWLVTARGPRSNDPRDVYRGSAAVAVPPERLHDDAVENAAAARRLARNTGDFCVLPRLDSQEALASEDMLSPERVVGPAFFYAKWCPSPLRTDCVRVEDDTMAPGIPQGALVGVDHTQRGVLESRGAVVAAWLAKRQCVVIRRLVYTEDTGAAALVHTKADGQPPHPWEPGDRIIGRVVAVHCEVTRRPAP